MKLLYEEELIRYLNLTHDEIISYAEQLIESDNAVNWQKANELSFMLRKNRKTLEAVEISKMMFEKESTVDKLNLYYVAVVDNGDIGEIHRLHNLVDNYLKQNNHQYQKHLFATWLKAANRIDDTAMFKYVYNMVPPVEKRENSYIISQYYVYLNHHSQYRDVIDHYNTLPEHVKNAKYVKKYYYNACSRLNLFPDYDDSTSEKTSQSTKVTPKQKRVFIVYGNNPTNLQVIKFVLGANKVDYVDLQEQLNNGQTIIEKFETEATKSDYAIVLCTPENEGKDGTWYPRQNVVFEWGYFMAHLGRQNVCMLYQENGKTIDLPSDCKGIAYISMDKGSWMGELVASLSAAGFPISFNN